MHIACVAIGALYPSVFSGYLKPDPWVPKCAFTAIAGDAVCVHDLGFGCLGCHVWFPVCHATPRLMTNRLRQGKSAVAFGLGACRSREMIRAGTPATVAPGGTFPVTTAFAPITA